MKINKSNEQTVFVIAFVLFCILISGINLHNLEVGISKDFSKIKSVAAVLRK